MNKPSYTLYHYWRSSSSWRVRWAFEHKKTPYSPIAISLLDDSTNSEEYRKLSPQGFVPVLILPDHQSLTESTAILEYVEETIPTPSLFPKETYSKAKVRELCQIINSGTQPHQNLSTLDVLSAYGISDQDRRAWARQWIEQGLHAYQQISQGKFSYGDELSMADLFLIPQLYNARRFEVDLKQFQKLLEIEKNCLELESYQKSHPDQFSPEKP